MRSIYIPKVAKNMIFKQDVQSSPIEITELSCKSYFGRILTFFICRVKLLEVNHDWSH